MYSSSVPFSFIPILMLVEASFNYGHFTIPILECKMAFFLDSIPEIQRNPSPGHIPAFQLPLLPGD